MGPLEAPCLAPVMALANPHEMWESSRIDATFVVLGYQIGYVGLGRTPQSEALQDVRSFRQ